MAEGIHLENAYNSPFRTLRENSWLMQFFTAFTHLDLTTFINSETFMVGVRNVRYKLGWKTNQNKARRTSLFNRKARTHSRVLSERRIPRLGETARAGRHDEPARAGPKRVWFELTHVANKKFGMQVERNLVLWWTNLALCFSVCCVLIQKYHN